MKTKYLIVLVAICSALSVRSQNTITFSGRVTDCESGMPVSSGFALNIYWAPGTTTDRNAFLRLGGEITLTPNGTFSTSGRTVPNAMPGQPSSFYATAWETAFGTSYEVASQVQGARVGQSEIVSVTILPAPETTSVRIPDFEVCPVPEPSTMVLAALGTACALLLRRRK